VWRARIGWFIALVCAACGTPQSIPTKSPPGDSIRIDVTPVLLNPKNPSEVSIGEFVYAGGLALTSSQTDRLHELSDMYITDDGRLTAVGDEGILFEAQLVLDQAERLVGLADARVELLTGEDGKPLSGKSETDAEGFTYLPNGDRLVAFEQHHRIWLYPSGGGAPRPAPAPLVAFPGNEGMEALAADPEAGTDAYLVGAEQSGDVWKCRLSVTACTQEPSVGRPDEFGLVGISRLPQNETAYLLRAFDPARGPRIMLKILRSTESIAQLDMALPMTVDNF
jgi:hypothetical protein